MLTTTTRNKLIRLISTGAKVSFRTTSLSDKPTLTVIPPKITSKITGYFSIKFYRLQVRYMEECMRLNTEFEWIHPYKIETDEAGIVWYQNTCPKFNQMTWWRPGPVDLDSKKILNKISYLER